ncbi:hypothetical protein L6R50_24130 [Myxococcota bacterium]|nr:hypothetical protein [Myxococcota bacterium]
MLFLAAAFTFDPTVARADPLVEWGETFLEAVVDPESGCGEVAMTQHWFCFPTEIDGCPGNITELGWDDAVDRLLGATGDFEQNGSAHLTVTSGCGDAIIDPYFAMAVDPELSLDYTIPPDSIVHVKGWVRTSDARSEPVVRVSWRWFDGTKGHDLQKTTAADSDGDGMWDVEYTVGGVVTPWTATRIPVLDAGIDPLWVPFESSSKRLTSTRTRTTRRTSARHSSAASPPASPSRSARRPTGPRGWGPAPPSSGSMTSRSRPGKSMYGMPSSPRWGSARPATA